MELGDQDVTAKTKRARKADAPLPDENVEVSKMEAHALAEAGLAEWAAGLPDEDTEDMMLPESWTPVRWEPVVGWVKRTPRGEA